MPEWWPSSRPGWSWGPWSVDLDDAGMAAVRFHGSLVLRAVRAVVRDDDWNTCRIEIDSVSRSGPALTLQLRCEDRGASMRGVLTAEAGPDTLDFRLDLATAADFQTNRVGLVVLHPASLSGTPLAVTHPDGATTETSFPGPISPRQPAFAIAGLAWNGAGCRAELRLAGDVFEMEDQRNWTDASYKTYSRPLELPFPYRLAAGEHVTQTASLRATRRAGSSAQTAQTIELASAGPFPALGIGASSAPDHGPDGPREFGTPTLVELDLGAPNWRAALERAAAPGDALDVRLVLADDTPAATEGLEDAAAALAALGGNAVVRAAAFWPSGPSRHVADRSATSALRAALDAAGIRTEIVGGARSHFTELNRERHRLADDLDGVVFALTPLFHELGTLQLLESVAMQRLVALQAVRDSVGVPVHIGPITLRPRYNDCAATPPRAASGPTLTEGYGPQFADADDERQRRPELAAWTIASAAALAVPGVASLSYFEDWGPRGIRAADGTEYPVADALRELARLTGQQLLHGDSIDGLVWAIGATGEGRETVLLSNLDRRTRTVTIATPSSSRSVTVPGESWRRVEG